MITVRNVLSPINPPTRLWPGIKKCAADPAVRIPKAVPKIAALNPNNRKNSVRKKKGFKTVLKSPTIVSTIPPSTENPFLMVPFAEKEEDLKFFF